MPGALGGTHTVGTPPVTTNWYDGILVAILTDTDRSRTTARRCRCARSSSTPAARSTSSLHPGARASWRRRPRSGDACRPGALFRHRRRRDVRPRQDRHPGARRRHPAGLRRLDFDKVLEQYSARRPGRTASSPSSSRATRSAAAGRRVNIDDNGGWRTGRRLVHPELRRRRRHRTRRCSRRSAGSPTASPTAHGQLPQRRRHRHRRLRASSSTASYVSATLGGPTRQRLAHVHLSTSPPRARAHRRRRGRGAATTPRYASTTSRVSAGTCRATSRISATNGNPRCIIDATGRKVTTDTGRPSLIPLDNTTEGASRSRATGSSAGGGNDVLNVVTSGVSADPDVMLDTYYVPVHLLPNGLPVLYATTPPASPYHLAPERASTSAASRCSTRSPARRSSTPAATTCVYDVFTAPSSTTRSATRCSTPSATALHIAGDPVVHRRGEQQTWLGGEATFDELGNPVYTGRQPVPARLRPGQDLRPRRADLGRRRGFGCDATTETCNSRVVPGRRHRGRPALHAETFVARRASRRGTELDLSDMGLLATDRVWVTVYEGSKIYNLLASQYSHVAGGVTINRAYTGRVRFAITIERMAVHAAGTPKYYDGHEIIAPNSPGRRRPGQPRPRTPRRRQDLAGVRADGQAARVLQLRRRRVVTVHPRGARTSGLTVTVGGLAATTTLQRGHATAHDHRRRRGRRPGARVLIAYMGPRLHRRGEPVYKPKPVGPGFEQDLYTGTELKKALGNEARLNIGGEQAFYLADDQQEAALEYFRIDADGADGMADGLLLPRHRRAQPDHGRRRRRHHGRHDDHRADADRDQRRRRPRGRPVDRGRHHGPARRRQRRDPRRHRRRLLARRLLRGERPRRRDQRASSTSTAAPAPTRSSSTTPPTPPPTPARSSGSATTRSCAAWACTSAGIDYSTLEQVAVNLGSGNDTFTVESTHEYPLADGLVLEGRGGNDSFRIKTTDTAHPGRRRRLRAERGPRRATCSRPARAPTR